MRVFQIEGDWGIDNLKLSQRTQPQAGAGQVLVSMRASSLNFRDLVVPERGYGNYTGELPLIPISDGMGVVSAVGPGVTRVKVGDRVCPTYFQSWQGGDPDLQRLTQSLGGPIDGTMTETMCLSEQGVVMVPDYLTGRRSCPSARLRRCGSVCAAVRQSVGSPCHRNQLHRRPHGPRAISRCRRSAELPRTTRVGQSHSRLHPRPRL